MQQFSFFDAALLEDLIQFVDIGVTVREGNIEKALAAITDRVEQDEPTIVVIDSFKAIGELLQERTQARTFVYDLSVHMASWGATTLLVGEYRDEDLGTWPEFVGGRSKSHKFRQPERCVMRRFAGRIPHDGRRERDCRGGAELAGRTGAQVAGWRTGWPEPEEARRIGLQQRKGPGVRSSEPSVVRGWTLFDARRCRPGPAGSSRFWPTSGGLRSPDPVRQSGVWPAVLPLPVV